MKIQRNQSVERLIACILTLVVPMSGAEAPAAGAKITTTTTSASAPASSSEIEQLKAMLFEQQRQIDELRKQLSKNKESEQKKQDNSAPVMANDSKTAPALGGSFAPKAPLGEVASTTAMVPNPPAPAPAPVFAPPATPAPADAATLDSLQKTVNAINAKLGGFKFSGDLRFRFDLLSRSANAALPPTDNRATPAQRARERIRVRLNVDKDLFYNEKDEHPLVKFHLQLATDPYNNPITMDSDFAGLGTRAPFSIAEAWAEAMPVKGVTLRIGRTSEIFADNRQFMFDDDIRFNGFHETYHLATKDNKAFVDFKAGQYILTDPNVQVVPAGSPYLAAGYKAGQRIPSAGFFDTGATVGGNLSKKWKADGTINYVVYREPNQIQLASTANGAALFANNPIVGATFIGNLGGTGNATTTAGGGTYFANDFHVVREAFNLTYAGTPWRGHNMPLTMMAHFTQNTGASIQNKAYMFGAALGEAKKLGDVQIQYQYYFKPANAFVSQFSDDDVGTGSGVNIKNNQIRVNFGITRWLAWENRLYIQKGITTNNPAIGFFVPLQQGYNTQFRWHSHLAFTF